MFTMDQYLLVVNRIIITIIPTHTFEEKYEDDDKDTEKDLIFYLGMQKIDFFRIS